jgi:hypothetical protein
MQYISFDAHKERQAQTQDSPALGGMRTRP